MVKLAFCFCLWGFQYNTVQFLSLSLPNTQSNTASDVSLRTNCNRSLGERSAVWEVKMLLYNHLANISTHSLPHRAFSRRQTSLTSLHKISNVSLLWCHQHNSPWFFFFSFFPDACNTHEASRINWLDFVGQKLLWPHLTCFVHNEQIVIKWLKNGHWSFKERESPLNKQS